VSPLPAFIPFIQEACESEEAGFHFEEGGCYAMAFALQRVLRRMGIPTSLVVVGDGSHALCRVEEMLIDYTGASPLAHWNRRPLREISPLQLYRLGRRSRWGTQMLDDIIWAEKIIRIATQFAEDCPCPA
jgi:hypothetical protein